MSTTVRPRLLTCSVAVVLALGCASSPGAAAGSPGATRSTSDVITRQELADPSLVGATALDAVRHLRPRFLNERGGALKGASEQVQVSLNGAEPRPTSELARIDVADVEEIRYLSTAEAGLRFGLRGSMGPVLVITSRKR